MDVFGEIVGVEEVLVAFQSLSTIKFLRQLLRNEVPWSKTKNQKKKKNNTLCQHRSLLRQLYCAAYDEGAETPKIQELFALYKEKKIQIKFEKKKKIGLNIFLILI